MFLLDAELELRSQNASQWIVGLSYFFQDARKAHFVNEYLPGGNFMGLLEALVNLLNEFTLYLAFLLYILYFRNGGYMEVPVAMFYLGELVLAINAVHCIGFAHR